MKTYMVCILLASMLTTYILVANNEDDQNPLDIATMRLEYCIRVRNTFGIRSLIRKHGMSLLGRDITIENRVDKPLGHIIRLQNPDLVRLGVIQGASLTQDHRQAINSWRNLKNRQEALGAWQSELRRRTMELIRARSGPLSSN